MGSQQKESDGSTGSQEIWILVDHSAREASLIPIVEALEERGHRVELVTITEVIGSAAREALAGGAERLLRGLRVATRGGEGRDEDLVGAIRRRQPDMLVVTEARYARAIGVMEKLTGVRSLQVGLVSDFYVDPGWFNGQLHGFVVPDEATGDDVVDRGVSQGRVKIGGPAIRPAFDESVDRKAARKEFGFDDEERVVLVRADGFDIATLEKLVFQCTLCDVPARFIFHHDGDGATASALRRAADEYGLQAAMFGQVADLNRYFAAADAHLASEDDPMLAELLASSTPSLLIDDGREQGSNGAVLAAREVAAYLDDVRQLGSRLDRFLEESQLDDLRDALQSWEATKRHQKLVQALDEIVQNKENWGTPIGPSASKPDKADDDDGSESETSAGPFESIGSQSPAASDDDEDTASNHGPSRANTLDSSPLSRAEAKEQLAELIMKERDAERRLDELEKQQQRWRDRLDLAREWNEADLMEEAESILRGYVDEADPLEQRLKEIRHQKQKLKAAARPAGDSDGEEVGDVRERASRMEERFQEMEVDRDLEGLKDRIRRELGE